MKRYLPILWVFLFLAAGTSAAAPPTLEDCWEGEGTAIYPRPLTLVDGEETFVVNWHIEARVYQRENGLIRGAFILTTGELNDEITLSFTGFMNKLKALKGTSWATPVGPSLQDPQLIEASMKNRIFEGTLRGVFNSSTTHFALQPVDCPPDRD